MCIPPIGDIQPFLFGDDENESGSRMYDTLLARY